MFDNYELEDQFNKYLAKKQKTKDRKPFKG